MFALDGKCDGVQCDGSDNDDGVDDGISMIGDGDSNVMSMAVRQ